EKLVWAVGALAEGLGIRAVARVFEVDPNTVLQWLVEVADHAAVFTQYFLHDVRVTQVQLDELFALLSAVKAGEVSEAVAIARLSRSPHRVWAAIDPVTKLLLTVDVGDRTLAMAQRVVHQVVQVLAPDCVPLFLTDGFKEYATALLTHFGQWVQLARQRAQGPAPQPRWMPLPGLLYAQVVKTVRRRRLVRVQHRVVFGTLAAVQQVPAACGWRPVAGRSTPRSWSGSTSACASMWRRLVVASPRSARVRTACVSSWACITCTIISVYLTPAYATLCSSRSRRMARARPSAGSR